ncbi:MAG TPA: ABC transporter permease subunit, partial [Verrucomicrobiae bacterium]|nr:ABC transporter permease subunit [Verrucomicrobiae bacterium]
EELKKDYIRAAKARGLSKLQLVRNHLLRATVLKILATLGPVLTLVISNLIIVEYLTLYPGLVFSLIKFYQQNDTVAFIGFALSLGFIYILLNFLVKLVLKLLSPANREVAK